VILSNGSYLQLLLSSSEFYFFTFSVLSYIGSNKDKSAAKFCRHVAGWVSDMFCNFHLAKNHKIADNSTATKAREKISTDLESLEFCDVFLTKFKNNQFFLATYFY
jgi:hypothetical protein